MLDIGIICCTRKININSGAGFFIFFELFKKSLLIYLFLGTFTQEITQSYSVCTIELQ